MKIIERGLQFVQARHARSMGGVDDQSQYEVRAWRHALTKKRVNDPWSLGGGNDPEPPASTAFLNMVRNATSHARAGGWHRSDTTASLDEAPRTPTDKVQCGGG